MPTSKEISVAFTKKVVDAYEPGKGFKKTSKLFHYKENHQQVVFQMTANLSRAGLPSKFSPSANHLMQKEVSKNANISSRDLQVTLATVGVKVHVVTIRKSLYKFDLCGRCARKNSLCCPKRTLE